MKRGLLILVMLFAFAQAFVPTAEMQATEFTLAGEWIVTSTPINGEAFSRLGNTLGFPERDMHFSEEGGVRTGFVDREDVGTSVHPLGVWRVSGDRLSATFQLWCPNKNTPCGTVIMRGRFTRTDRIRGTMTVFFEEADTARPTGYDTWVFDFRGDKIGGGATQ